jgi:hypothetical protein
MSELLMMEFQFLAAICQAAMADPMSLRAFTRRGYTPVAMQRKADSFKIPPHRLRPAIGLAKMIAGLAKSCYEPAMNGKYGKSDELARRKAFVLQDHKRLPGRFSARLSGALTCRIG